MCLTNKKIRDRFENEATTMAKLHHKNIVVVHDIRDEMYSDPDGLVSINLVYMVMEMLPGGSLKDRIDDHGLLHPQQAIDAAIAMAAGLGYAHENNVVHRDIKLDNVLIGSDNALKVTDFGIAQIDGGSGMTQTGATMGTLAYMAPEQKLSSRRATALSDLYSVGASLYVMLTNKNPSELYATDIQEVGFASLPEEAAEFLRKSCHLDPKERYQNAEEMISALESLRPVFGKLPNDSLPFYIPREDMGITDDDILRQSKKVNTMWTTLLGIDPDEISAAMPRPKVVTPNQNTNETAMDFDFTTGGSDTAFGGLDLTGDIPQEVVQQVLSNPPVQEVPIQMSPNQNPKCHLLQPYWLCAIAGWFVFNNNPESVEEPQTNTVAAAQEQTPEPKAEPVEQSAETKTATEENVQTKPETEVESAPQPKEATAEKSAKPVVKELPKPKPKKKVEAKAKVEEPVPTGPTTYGKIAYQRKAWANIVNGKPANCINSDNRTPAHQNFPLVKIESNLKMVQMARSKR